MHYLDLPILQYKPTYNTLKEAISQFQVSEAKDFDAVDPLDKGIRQWLSRLACNGLEWIGGEDLAEELRTMASRRLAMECGVTASSLRIRTVDLDGFVVKLKEPGMTEDHLGRLTWGSSLILAKRLAQDPSLVAGQRVIELGAGTGLCGIAASLVGAATVDVTDLPDIVPNLAQNVELNSADCKAYVLDWAAPEVTRAFDVCIISDPVYSREHPTLLLNAVAAVNAPQVLLMLPLRKGFEQERQRIFDGLGSQGYGRVEAAEEEGRDLFGHQTFAYSKYTKHAKSNSTL